MITRCPWPSEGDHAEPFEEPDHFDYERAWRDYEAVGGDEAQLPHNEAIQATVEARTAIREAWRTGNASALPALAAQLLVDHERYSSDRHYPAGTDAVHESLLVRLAANIEPAVGSHAVDRLLGPWATVTRMPDDARLLQIAMAAGAFMRIEEQPFSPRRMWTHHKPVPDTALRTRVRAIAHAAFTVWPILEVGPTWTLGPGVGAESPGTIGVPEPASLPGQPPPKPGDTLAARIVNTPRGWEARLPIVIPGPIPAAAESWLDLLLLEHRLADRRAGPRDVLRSTGHVLVRRVLEAAWIQ